MKRFFMPTPATFYLSSCSIKHGLQSMRFSLKDTIQFATAAHSGQFRKDGKTPYIVHPLSVAAEAGMYCLPIEVQQACILHDTIEDCGVSKEDISRKFGEYVAELVYEVTNPSIRPEHKQKRRAERIRINIEHIAGISQFGKTIKMLDAKDNLSDTLALLHIPSEAAFARKYLEEKKELFKVTHLAHPRIAIDLAAILVDLEAALNKVQS